MACSFIISFSQMSIFFSSCFPYSFSKCIVGTTGRIIVSYAWTLATLHTFFCLDIFISDPYCFTYIIYNYYSQSISLDVFDVFTCVSVLLSTAFFFKFSFINRIISTVLEIGSSGQILRETFLSTPLDAESWDRAYTPMNNSTVNSA